LNFRHLKLWHIEHWFVSLLALLSRCCLPLTLVLCCCLLLFSLLCFLGLSFFFPLFHGFLLQLSLFVFGLLLEQGLDGLPFVFIKHLVDAHRVGLKASVEGIHSLRVSIDDFDVLIVVISLSALDLVQKVETLLQLFVKADVMDGLSHFFHLFAQLVFLVLEDVVVMVSTLS
jgi:hypothetical protein